MREGMEMPYAPDAAFCRTSGAAEDCPVCDRPESPTRGRIMEVLLGRPDNYALLQIPPRVWYGFTAAGSVPAVICNCPDIPHDPAEGLRKDVDSRDIPYHW